MAGYALDNSWEHARRRLSLLERHLDPPSIQRMERLGVGEGWHCLEVGAGGGSMARWLCGRVGPTGRVLATDIDIGLLADIEAPQFEARVHDVTAQDLPEGEFDLVHTRWLLHHLPDPKQALERMVKALRPGGWLLVEEVDFFPVQTSTSPIYVEFMLGWTGEVVRASGRDCLWARALPELVARTGLVDVDGEGRVAVLRGGSPIADFYALSVQQMRERILASRRLPAEVLDQGLALLKDPSFWALGDGQIAMWGKRPH